MKYKVLSDAELRAQRGLLPDGIYDYEVVDAVEKAARENPDHLMMELTLKVKDATGNLFSLKDWLLGYDEKFVWKIKSFLDSCGRSEKYDGELTVPNCLGAKGKLRTRTGKSKRGEDQVFVANYLIPSQAIAAPLTTTAAVAGSSSFPDDDIKF